MVIVEECLKFIPDTIDPSTNILWNTYNLLVPHRVAVPVLVKDGKPCSGSESSDADTTSQGISNHSNHHPVKSEYTLPESSTGLGEVRCKFSVWFALNIYSQPVWHLCMYPW